MCSSEEYTEHMTIKTIKIILILLVILVILVLLVHHYYIHRFDSEKTLTQKWFQWTDVNNHETIEVLLLGFIAGLLVFLCPTKLMIKLLQ